MQPPRIYSLESYEPAELRPEETKQNNIFLRRAFSEKKNLLLNYKFNAPNIPILNPRIINNERPINNPVLTNKLTNTRNMTNIPLSITIKNPFFYNNPVTNNSPNKVLNTIQFNNPFYTNKMNHHNRIIKHIKPIPNKNQINNQITNYPQQIYFGNPLSQNHIYRSTSPQFVQNFSKLYTWNNSRYNNNIYKNKNIIPVYRRIIYRQKN